MQAQLKDIAYLALYLSTFDWREFSDLAFRNWTLGFRRSLITSAKETTAPILCELCDSVLYRLEVYEQVNTV